MLIDTDIDFSIFFTVTLLVTLVFERFSITHTHAGLTIILNLFAREGETCKVPHTCETSEL